jgi:hypothetical protein
MLTLRQRIFTIVGITSGLLIAIVLGIVYLGNSDEYTKTNTVDENVIDSDNPQIINLPQQQVLVTQPTQSPEELYVKNLAKLFVERFSTYSNQNNNEHIVELRTLATPSMWQWIQGQVQIQALGQQYQGLVTEVLAAQISSFNLELGEAVVAIEVQQKSLAENDSGLVDENMVQKSATVNVKKIDSTWLVDGVFWE